MREFWSTYKHYKVVVPKLLGQSPENFIIIIQCICKKVIKNDETNQKLEAEH